MEILSQRTRGSLRAHPRGTSTTEKDSIIPNHIVVGGSPRQGEIGIITTT